MVSDKTEPFLEMFKQSKQSCEFQVSGEGGGHLLGISGEGILAFSIRKVRLPYKSWLLHLLAR